MEKKSGKCAVIIFQPLIFCSMKRFLLGVCAVISAAVLVFSVCGSKYERTPELFADNVEALTEPEVIITVGRLCMLQNQGVVV